MVACAAGSDETGSTSTVGGGAPWTTSNGAGGEGGIVTSGGSGEGGSGAQSSSGGAAQGGGVLSVGGGSVTGGGGAGQGGEGGTAQGGAPPVSGQAVLVALGPTMVMAGHFETSSGWVTESHPAAATARPALAIRAEDDAVALFRDDGALAFTVFDGAGWSVPADVGSAVTTRDTPAATASAAQVLTVFHGDDYKHYFGAFTASFNPLAEPIGNPQSFGPRPATIAFASGNPVVVFTGSDGDLYDQIRVAGAWQPATAHGLTGVDGIPAVVALDQGTELLAVFNRTSTAVSYSIRSGGTWSSPSDLPSTLTSEPVALAALPGGRAALAFRGTNGKAYASVFDPSGSPVWTSPVPIDGVNGADTSSTPAIAAGVGDADAELVFIGSATGQARHARLVAGSWTASTLVGGSGLASVALASTP